MLCRVVSPIGNGKHAGFRDHAVYRGQQVFFYKRAQVRVHAQLCVLCCQVLAPCLAVVRMWLLVRLQIVAADVWAAYGCQRLPAAPGAADTVPLGAFYDVHELTMFGTALSARLCGGPARCSGVTVA
jgi:hypothetical protein